jgi:tetratricopeptide (TPR) repeat protein
MKRALVALLLACAAPHVPGLTQPAAVRIGTGSLEIPTYAEGPANENPPFELFTFGRLNYPYPIRDALTDRREPVTWRTVYLENDYLRLTVLPDLGGHVYSCVDKRNGREMFYANSAIKKALIGYRGAWAALGVEFNFPVSHNWVSMSPVDFATETHEDGSASIVVANTDRVYGGRWRVALRLRPGRAALEQTVDLYNPGAVRHRYYWWSNAAVRAWEDSRLVYPTELMATHGFTSIVPWPVDRRGRDMSLIRNQADGPVSLFTYGTREGFVGVYHPETGSGTVHVADPAELPVHKVWSWGNDREAAAWREALSDDDSRYVELQAGLFRNQETYAFLEPQESVRFTETWVPVRDLGGITRANGDAVLHMERTAAGRMRIALDVTREMPDVHIRIRQGPTIHVDTDAALSPREVWRADVAAASPPMTFELTDASGFGVLRHVEHAFDRIPAPEVKTGPQPDLRPAPSGTPSAAEAAALGELDELEGRRLAAMGRYQAALQHDPDDGRLLKAAGRLAVALGWADSGGSVQPQMFGAPAADAPARDLALAWLTRAHAVNPTDLEAEYYLGVALAAARRTQEARAHLESAARFRSTRIPAALALARLRASEGGLEPALAIVRRVLPAAPRASAIGALEVSLLRRLDRRDEALERARYWRSIDPADSVIRLELAALGQEDPGLWAHLAADASRVIELADACLANGLVRDALTVLEHPYPAVAPPMREPGAVAPEQSVLVAYYRAYVRMLAGGRFALDGDVRSRSTRYEFPNRRSSYPVLVSALQANPADHVARFLLGSLYMSGGLTAQAVGEWQRVRADAPTTPTLHRNLGLALLHGEGGAAAARPVLEEGLASDRENADIYMALDGVLSAGGAAPAARAAALGRYPSPERMPMPMLAKLAVALAEAGRAADAERLFHGRHFPREEGGTNVRAVYVQVRLASARAAAAAGACRAAREILDALPAAQADLPFTAGGLADALQAPAMAAQAAAVDAACGRAAAARAAWQRLDGPLESGGSPLATALAVQARQRLGTPLLPGERRRVEEAAAAATRSLDRGDAGNPGSLEYARALLFAALGRRAESQRSLQRVFILPDRNLSHAVARALPPHAAAARR